MERIKYPNRCNWIKNGVLCRNHDLPAEINIYSREWRSKYLKHLPSRYLRHLPSSIEHTGQRMWYEKGHWIGFGNQGIFYFFPYTIDYRSAKNKILTYYKK